MNKKNKKLDYTINENGCFVCSSHFKNPQGYAVRFRKRKTLLIHRFVYEEMFGEIPKGLLVRHKCDNPSCINPEHLELGTHQENMDDKVLRNRSCKGEKSPLAKLTEKEVVKIKKLLSSMNNVQLSKMFGVHPVTISCIRHKKSWKHI